MTIFNLGFHEIYQMKILMSENSFSRQRLNPAKWEEIISSATPKSFGLVQA